MRKDTSIISSALLPEKQETISKLADLSRASSQMERIDSDVNTIRTLSRKVLDTTEDTVFETLVERITAYKDIKEIEALTDEQINELLTIEGESIGFVKDGKNGNDDAILRRDYITFVFNSETEVKRLDEAKLELQAIMDESDEELRSIFEDVGGDVTTYVNDSIIEAISRLEIAETLTEEEAQQLEKLRLIKSKLDESVTLDSIIDYVNKYDARNIINDYNHRSEDVGERYARNIKKINLSVNFFSFRNIEANFIKEEALLKYPDMFSFIVMRYLAAKKDINVLDGVFASQLSYELRLLYTLDPAKATETQLARRESLLGNIKLVLNTLYIKAGLL